MSLKALVALVLRFYPRIFFACHTRHLVDELAGVSLTAHQGSILDHLDESEPMTLGDLAAHMGVTPSTMSISIERLVKLGYVIRLRDESDKRRLRLLLSEEGSRVRRAKSVLDPVRVKSVLLRLPPRQRLNAVEGLRLLAVAAEQEMTARMAEARERRVS